jgi:hypothetical protein
MAANQNLENKIDRLEQSMQVLLVSDFDTFANTLFYLYRPPFKINRKPLLVSRMEVSRLLYSLK